MFLFLGAIIAGFAILVWSADKFVDGAAATAKHLGMPSLLIGILIVGFGTSAPEMVVSAIAAMEGLNKYSSTKTKPWLKGSSSIILKKTFDISCLSITSNSACNKASFVLKPNAVPLEEEYLE